MRAGSLANPHRPLPQISLAVVTFRSDGLLQGLLVIGKAVCIAHMRSRSPLALSDSLYSSVSYNRACQPTDFCNKTETFSCH
jgi:hypothetical protein